MLGICGWRFSLLVWRWLAMFFSPWGMVVFASSLLVLVEPLAFLEGAQRRRPPNCVPKSQLLGEPTFTVDVDVSRQSSSAAALLVEGKAGV
ncbi:hypothetical protein CORC01_06346 [Colletotrichum orchidophilum]|uniref:Uncharacterized protein n=1 Tax=Colletotrichum orchidophilum TaxID=1209926 RepID=A0A1G4BAC2_9PEZI|nr:uncharacterized protein CORC01_06346 [Colletotrichum orchidophilum]OHE98350.1 hypothetical protein CORC01_06346 [Colletotrichum orchidophilum]